MAEDIDTTLPESSSPTLDPYLEAEHGVPPFAVYIHARGLSDSEVEELLRECNSKLEQGDRDHLRLAPNHDFQGQPLRASYDYHLNQILPANEYDPFQFVAIIYKEWKTKGVMVVTLTDDDLNCEVDKLVVPAKESGIMLANLQIANMDWEDFKEEYGDSQEDDNDDDANDDHHDDSNDNDEDNEQDELDNEKPDNNKLEGSSDDEERYHDGASSKLPVVGYYIGVYAIEGIDFETLFRDLENGPYQRPREELETQAEGNVPRGENKAMEKTSELHPQRCLDNPGLCRDMFLIADTERYFENGLILGRLEWDKTIKGRTRAELADIGRKAEWNIKRLPAAKYATIQSFNEFVKGYRPWSFDHWTFIVYGGNAVYEGLILDYLDPKHEKRNSGRQWFLVGSHENGVRPEKEMHAFAAANPWEGTVKRHPLQVYRERFCDTLNRQCFVYVDKKITSADDLVTLVKLNWDGAVEGKSVSELWGCVDLGSKCSTLQCPAGQAYTHLVDFANGKSAFPK